MSAALVADLLPALLLFFLFLLTTRTFFSFEVRRLRSCRFAILFSVTDDSDFELRNTLSNDDEEKRLPRATK